METALDVMQLQGDVLEQLARLKAEGVKVRTCVTSPPYWGLRAYGTNPQVWQNGHDLCVEHEWSAHRHNVHTGTTKSKINGNAERNLTQYVATHDTCLKCGAWRGELGLEPTPEMYVAHLVQVFRAVRDVSTDDCTLWVNIADTYVGGKGQSGANPPEYIDKRKARGSNTLEGKQHCIGAKGYTKPGDDRALLRESGLKPKDRAGIPHMLAFALRADGWWWRDEIVWHKPNPMPESVKDRTTKSHEFIFVFSKSPKYFYDADAIAEPAAYDGRKDEMMKGSRRYANGHAPASPNTLHVKGHKRWDKNERGQRIRNKRSVWRVNTAQFDLELCENCKRTYDKKTYRKLAEHIEIRNGQEVKARICACGSFDKWLSHFATFPPDLIEPCILAGTSAKGQCPQCGAAWERVVDVKQYPRHETEYADLATDGNGANRGKHAQPTERNTIGWQPSCACGVDPVPDLVLDPFGGSGTTAEVALKHGRRAILIELNPSYVELQKARLAKVQRVMA